MSPFEGARGQGAWDALLGERERPSIELLAACLMPDHLHVVAKPAERSIVAWLGSFKSYTTKVVRDAGGARFTWQPSFHDRVIRNPAELEATLRYVMENPMRAGLVAEGEQWPWVWCHET